MTSANDEMLMAGTELLISADVMYQQYQAKVWDGQQQNERPQNHYWDRSGDTLLRVAHNLDRQIVTGKWVASKEKAPQSSCKMLGLISNPTDH